MDKLITKRVERSHCLWVKNGPIEDIEKNRCNCTQYIPDGAVCKCGHSELWHKRNNDVTDMIRCNYEITSKISPYINSLNKQIMKLQAENKTLIEKCSNNRNNMDKYQCIMCMKNPKCRTLLPCLHTHFCKECCDTWLSKKNNCPVCRKSVTAVLDIIL